MPTQGAENKTIRGDCSIARYGGGSTPRPEQKTSPDSASLECQVTRLGSYGDLTLAVPLYRVHSPYVSMSWGLTGAKKRHLVAPSNTR